MRTVILGEPPAGFAELIERRRALDQDRYDEVWEGEYHVVPAPGGPHAVLDDEVGAVLRAAATPRGLVPSTACNIGRGPDDFRVPDRALHREPPAEVFLATAAMVVEIRSPDDETWDKLGHYARHAVDEVLVIDPADRSVTWLLRDGDEYRRAERSALLDLGSDELAAQLRWP